MKRFVPRIPGIVVVVFALCSLGADSSSSGCKPSGSTSNKSAKSNQNPSKPWCHNDPPIFCAAYCADYDLPLPNKACYEIGADLLAAEFMDMVDAFYQERVDLGEHLCTGYDPYNYVTPCQVGIIPQEHANQDHESCEPVPPGCPMPK
jgi:hypothetical protein